VSQEHLKAKMEKDMKYYYVEEVQFVQSKQFVMELMDVTKGLYVQIQDGKVTQTSMR